MRSKGRTTSAGYTITEVAITVTLAGVLITGVVAIGSSIALSRRIDGLGERIALLVRAVNELFAGKHTFEGLNTESAVRLGLFSFEHVQVPASGSTTPPWGAFHEFKQPITIGVLGHTSFDGTAWGLHYARLPSQACMDVTQYISSLAVAVAVVSEPTGGGATTSFDEWGAKVTWNDGKVEGFPSGYTVLKKEYSTVPSVTDRANACKDIANGKLDFSMAMVYRKM